MNFKSSSTNSTLNVSKRIENSFQLTQYPANVPKFKLVADFKFTARDPQNTSISLFHGVKIVLTVK